MNLESEFIIKFKVGDAWYEYSPQPDITLQEAVRLQQMFMVLSFGSMTGVVKEPTLFIREHNLGRHFTPTTLS